MWNSKVIDFRLQILWIFMCAEMSIGLKNLRVTVPMAVKRGEDVYLICNYDLENDTLYSVKWYKGRREFFRYTYKETPAMKLFAVNGITVAAQKSNKTHVLLTDVESNISGKFSCEVSADAPSFHTMIVSGEMEVVELPAQSPTITGIQTKYKLPDNLYGNCTSGFSKPVSNLTWSINDVAVNATNLRSYESISNTTSNSSQSVLELKLSLLQSHFNNSKGRIKLICTSRIYSLYNENAIIWIEQERPKNLESKLSGPVMNLNPYVQAHDGELTDQSGLYLTHYKNMDTSSGTSTFSIKNHSRIMQIVWWLGCSSAISIMFTLFVCYLPFLQNFP